MLIKKRAVRLFFIGPNTDVLIKKACAIIKQSFQDLKKQEVVIMDGDNNTNNNVNNNSNPNAQGTTWQQTNNAIITRSRRLLKEEMQKQKIAC